jgi:hypothetical protein
MDIFRQSREAALIYTNTEEELKRIRNSKKRLYLWSVVAFVAAMLACLFLLGSIALYEEGEKVNSGSLFITVPAFTIYGSSEYEDEEGRRGSYSLLNLLNGNEKIEEVHIEFKFRWLRAYSKG